MGTAGGGNGASAAAAAAAAAAGNGGGSSIYLNDASSSVAGGNFTIKYFPESTDLNYWMLAMIGIGCVFIIFVGFSIYLMCKSTSSEPRVRTLVAKEQS